MVIIIDYDTGKPMIHTTALHATRRIDSYRVRIKGVIKARQAGWSAVCERLRLMLPRVRAI